MPFGAVMASGVMTPNGADTLIFILSMNGPMTQSGIATVIDAGTPNGAETMICTVPMLAVMASRPVKLGEMGVSA